MDQNNPTKKPSIQLKLMFSASIIDKSAIKKMLLENFKMIPQEDRLIVWKLMLGKRENQSID